MSSPLCRACPPATAFQTTSMPSTNMVRSNSSLYYLCNRLPHHIVTTETCCFLPSTCFFFFFFCPFSPRSSLLLSVSIPSIPLYALQFPFPP